MGVLYKFGRQYQHWLKELAMPKVVLSWLLYNMTTLLKGSSQKYRVDELLYDNMTTLLKGSSQIYRVDELLYDNMTTLLKGFSQI